MTTRNVYRYDRDGFTGVELRVANNGRTPTSITAAGFEDSEGNGVFLEESERLDPGGVGVYWFALEEFQLQELEYESLRPVIEAGHGDFHGDQLEPDSARSIRIHCEELPEGPVSKPLAVDPGTASASRHETRPD
jgi:hypothetical protein